MVSLISGGFNADGSFSFVGGNNAGAYSTFTYFPVPVVTPLQPAIVPASTGVSPLEVNYSLYGHPVPVSLGKRRIGGEIIAGPTISGGLASFCISFGVPFDPIGATCDLREIAFDSEVVWSSDGVTGVTTSAGGTFRVEAFTFRFYPGTLTQAADPLEIAEYGANAVAYRPQILIWFENLPLAATKFKKIPYVAAVIGDTNGDDINLGDSLELVAYSPFVGLTSAQFETVGITDVAIGGGIIVAQDAEFLGLIQKFGKYYGSWDILQTDKLRVVDRGDNLTADISLDATRLMDKIVVNRQGQDTVARELALSTIDPDADYTIIESLAQRPNSPVAVTTSVSKASDYLPIVLDASTRQALVALAKYREEQNRKTISGTAMAYGLQMEPGDLVAIQDLGDHFTDEIFKVVETLHTINNTVQFTAQSILRCNITEGPCVNSGHADAFLARVVATLDATHINAYTALLDGLDADELSCKLDWLHIYATQDGTTALMNLMSDRYNGTAYGSPTFTADRGFTGVESSSTAYIDANFNPATAANPQFSAGSSHIGAWSVLNDGGSLNGMIGHSGISGGSTSINPQSTPPAGTTNTAYFRCNSFGSMAVTNTNTQGHFLVNRTSNIDAAAYRNATSLISSAASNESPSENLRIVVLAENDNNTIGGSKRQIAAASMGSGLTPTDITNFYNRLRTYMTAVGVP